MRVIWTATARRDRERIARTIAEDDRQAAVKLDAKFGRAEKALSVHPHRGRLGRKPGTRELVVHPQYILIYVADAQTVTILTILHAARRWP
ncbi:type II toxin-antitoxin system RelE/ParE family toxin [Pelagibacterium sediminicola]|uniref:type II toxin-antitoxin system RelE/ParE family toxin n=1 Tax=Pelagibacterium sediminicola TaxID=2248761 RepID=UPI000E3153A6|nr:type II toxin-antitoxin system RelE/ParE family toxin [Pelagibacterium sediminicola]